MQQITFYETINLFLTKTICNLVQKCYISKLKVILHVPDKETEEFINQQLWSFAKGSFIPHGSSTDLYPELQPIYITTELKNPNNATTLILINNIIEYSNYSRVIFIYDNSNLEILKYTESEINKLKNAQQEFKHYKQTSPEKWKLM